MMKEAITILDKQLDQMANVFNIIPGDRFRLKETDILLIVQRKLEATDLKKALIIYNEIFEKTEDVELDKIKQSAVAYVKIKTLVENRAVDFDTRSKRALIKEFNRQIIKINNIIHLSTINSMAAEDYQKEKIKKIIEKNEEFARAFRREVDSLERQIERIPEEENTELRIQNKVRKNGFPKFEPKEIKPKEKNGDGFVVKVKQIFGAVQGKKEVEIRLKEEEQKKSQTVCGEIPFYDKKLVYTEIFDCKDSPLYVLMKRKGNIFWGLKKNIRKGKYDNSDHSLLELSEATEEFVQYMSVDLLNGEYKLELFTNEEKKSMKMYFDFMSWCFEQNIGTTLTVREYLRFKNYYNQMVLTMFKLEEKTKVNYYRALVLADKYVTYMECYDLSYSDEKKLIIENIMNEKSRNYISDLELIMEHHIVDKKALDDVFDCVKEMKYFNDDWSYRINKEEKKETNKREFLKEMSSEERSKLNNYSEKNEIDETEVRVGNLSDIQIKLQFLNKEHVVMDEALFATENLNKAVYDYLNRKAYIKKIGLKMNEREIYLYSSKNESLSVMILSETIRREANLNQGSWGQLIDFYEEKIRRMMVEMTD